MACLVVDPTILLVMVGVLTFLITFCGCVGSLRENICLLQAVSPGGRQVPPRVSPHSAAAPRRLFRGPPPPSHSSHPQFSVCLTVVFLLQLVAGMLGFIFSDKVPLGRGGWGAG